MESLTSLYYVLRFEGRSLTHDEVERAAADSDELDLALARMKRTRRTTREPAE